MGMQPGGKHRQARLRLTPRASELHVQSGLRLRASDGTRTRDRLDHNQDGTGYAAV